MHRDRLFSHHPYVGGLYFLGVLGFGMFYTKPMFLLLSGGLSTLYYRSLKGDQAWKRISGLLLAALVISLVNPFFSEFGERVLFTYLGGRKYTAEALVYGLFTGGLFYTMMMWFGSYHLFMTSDRYAYLFRNMAPSMSLLLVMIERLLPLLHKKYKAMETARSVMGREKKEETLLEKIRERAVLFSALLGWTLEGSISTADSMISRGYGLPGRRSFSLYTLKKEDWILLIYMAFLILMLMLALFLGDQGGGRTAFIEDMGPFFRSMLTPGVYGLFLATPLILNLLEEIKWFILKSEI
ncbi:energy-coupling factor transporter transmembrane component T [Proteiniclasticum ruminis]|uniref:Energy-coupling factor transport system permease protein n=1 Tax=Proteiniclasticum ruminis TaxID=398199 RepID=A0A1I5C0G5_9CLOT|nr:energy-coupling factor transporter transmembrane component T [Proteiniclasticum ruminis]SFN80426.1 energy-coupling factor transport system permease protein [Proteiniclasticum ruminis]